MNKFDASLQNEVHQFLLDWAENVKTLAMRNCPVKTGKLRASIYAKVQEWTVEVGAHEVYALMIEFGTKYITANPFLHPAIIQYLPQLEKLILDAIEYAKTESGFR